MSELNSNDEDLLNLEINGQFCDSELGSNDVNDSYLEVHSDLEVENRSICNSDNELDISVGPENDQEQYLSLGSSDVDSYLEVPSDLETNELDISMQHENELDTLSSSQQFNYETVPASTPLYEGASVTLLEAVAQHLLWFTDHPSMSKQALTDILYLQHHSILPEGNLLPDSYCKAIRMIKGYLVEPIVYDVCPNDCIIFRCTFSDLDKCPKCNANRYKSGGSSSIPVRTFHYLPLGPRLKRLFGISNLAQLLQEHGRVPSSSSLFDLHDSPSWKNAYSDSGIFQGDSRGISFSLCSDGVNPFSHLRCNYSMWPIVLNLLNLPRRIRHQFNNMFLVGIIPANGKKEAHTIHRYLEVLVDKMLSLSNAKIYDAYKQANFDLKIEVLIYILDYPGVGKLFNIHGAGSYKGCLWCDIKGNFKYNYDIYYQSIAL